MSIPRLSLRICGALLVAAFAAGCGNGHHSGRLKVPGSEGGGASGLGVHEVPIGTPITAETLNLCTTGKPVTIKGIRLTQVDHVVLLDWAWRRTIPASGTSAEHRGFASKAPGYSRGPIVYNCSATTGTVPEMAVTVKTTAPNGKFMGYWVDYDGGSAYVPFGLEVCALRTCPPGFEGDGLQD